MTVFFEGPEAISAMNVFYYLTYEGNCDLQAIQDPIMRTVWMISLALNFMLSFSDIGADSGCIE